MTSIEHVLTLAESKFKNIVEEPRLEAEILLSHVLQKPRPYLRAWPLALLNAEQEAAYLSLIKRRLALEPIAYLTGTKSFWTFDLQVTEATLIPRPETELLVETVLAVLPNTPLRLADLGTGSGAIAIALAMERPNWHIEGVDISESALSIARNNARQFALTNLSFSLSNWCDALPSSAFDAVVSNPPYIAESEWAAYAEGLQYEPRSALVSGTDGMDAIHHIANNAKRLLKSGGALFIEHGYLQGLKTRTCFLEMGYQEVQTYSDLAGCDRLTVGTNRRVD